jgi:hypothetical protein
MDPNIAYSIIVRFPDLILPTLALPTSRSPVPLPREQVNFERKGTNGLILAYAYC